MLKFADLTGWGIVVVAGPCARYGSDVVSRGLSTDCSCCSTVHPAAGANAVTHSLPRTNIAVGLFCNNPDTGITLC